MPNLHLTEHVGDGKELKSCKNDHCNNLTDNGGWCEDCKNATVSCVTPECKEKIPYIEVVLDGHKACKSCIKKRQEVAANTNKTDKYTKEINEHILAPGADEFCNKLGTEEGEEVSESEAVVKCRNKDCDNNALLEGFCEDCINVFMKHVGH